jgi:hypothetical protein
MGLVIMSERDLNHIEVLAQVDDGRLSVQNSANMLDIIKRQMFRLLKGIVKLTGVLLNRTKPYDKSQTFRGV